MVSFKHQSVRFINNVFTAISHVMTDVNITVNGYGLSINGMDSAHVSMIELFLEKSDFLEWEIESEEIYGLNLKILCKILSVGKEDDTVCFNFNKDTIDLTLQNKTRTIEFEIKLFNIDMETLGSPDIDYITTMNLTPKRYNEILDELGVVMPDSLTIKVLSKNNLHVETDGELGKTKMELHDAETIKIFSGEHVYQNRFAYHFMNRLKKLSDISDLLEISIGEDMPIKLVYRLTENSYVNYVVAPKIED